MSNEQNKKIVSDAIKEISKEQQEQEIKKIKNIVKCYLEKISDKKEKEDSIRKERLALEKDLDDLKAGRLDKIEERQGKDPIHDKVTVIEVRHVPELYIPFRPWQSQWIVEWKPPYFMSNCSTPYFGTGTTTNSVSGIQYQISTSGTYQVGTNIINL